MTNYVIVPHEKFYEKLNLTTLVISKVSINSKIRKVIINCSAKGMNCLKEQDIIYKELKRIFDDAIDIFFITECDKFIDKENYIKEVIEMSIAKLKSKNTTAKTYLNNFLIKPEENLVKIELNDKHYINMLKKEKMDIKLDNILREYGFDSFNIGFYFGDLTGVEFKTHEKVIDYVAEFEKKVEEERKQNLEKLKNSKETSYNGYSKFKNKDIKADAISIAEAYDTFVGEKCVIEGEVFYSEKRVLKNGNSLIVFRVYDKSESISVKKFLKPNEDFSVSTGEYVKVSGRVQVEMYGNDSKNEKVIIADSINKIESKFDVIEDKCEEKRVELHTHTKMSEMVGVCDVEDLIKRAKVYGHKSIAITDYGTVHSFPAAYKIAKNNDIKVIFGCEMYMVDDEEIMVQNSNNEDLSKLKIDEEEFVVFDLETLGLNSKLNEIIEIGAVKIKNGDIVSRFSELVNPLKPIPKRITEITKITNDMVEQKPTIEEVIARFYKFIDGATLVAHNAAFDMGFISRDIKKYLKVDLNVRVIDTLQMARDLYPDLKNYGLANLNKHLGLSLENHHRAVDDATATAKMFKIFLEKYKEKKAVTLEDINTTVSINVQKQSVKNIVVLVKNLTGLKNLYKLVSKSHIDYFGNKRPRIPKTILQENREGLLIGSSMSAHFMNTGELSELYFRNNIYKLKSSIDFYDYIEILPKSCYNELYEDEDTGTIKSEKDIEEMNKFIYELAKEKNKLVVASSNVHYLDREDYIARSILLYGSGNVYDEKQYKIDNGFYFRTTDMMLEEFNYLGEDIAREVVIKNTNAISEMTEMVKPVPDGFYPPSLENSEEMVREMTYSRAYQIYGNPLPDIVEQRLKRELDAIIGNGFSVLYLSAQKLVKKSLDNGYLVGSRGSVGSSLVAYMMGITEVNALYPHYICTNENCKHSEFTDKEGAGVDLPPKNCPKCNSEMKRDGYSIPFEVFMGFNGDKVPDIDLNFSGEYQTEIHRYCEELFGKENVFKAGTINTLAEKNALGYVKKYFEENNLKISDAELVRLSLKCQGAKKTTGQHPGGMIIVPRGNSIYEFCAVQRPANDMNNPSIITHYDYHVMDEQLVKLDLLGHDDPTTIKLLEEYTGVSVADIPLNDEATLKIFSSTESLNVTKEEIGSEVGTYGVPEFGTGFVREMLVDTKPKTFAELVRISGLSHGTDVWLNNAQEFVRSGEATLSEIITVRDDIMNYLIDQGIDKSIAFKIMEFVRKGKPSKDVEQWAEYSKLMKEKNVKDWYIESCRRIQYMFPKGHAVAYVMMAVRIAYFKVHYPLAFYAAYLSRKAEDFNYENMSNNIVAKMRLNDLSDISKIGKLDVKKKTEQNICEIIVEMYARGIELLPIDIYKSHGTKFTIEKGKIRIPLIGVSGLGLSVIENIVKEREKEEFLSVEDIKRRTKISQTVLEKLKMMGAIRDLNETNQIKLFQF